MAEKKSVRIQLVMSPSEVERLDEWRAARRIWSRSEAIRQLVAEGVERDEQEAAKRDGKKR
jgi:metal-responsive CopG/Arc/MetJ family transcriptional regulator